MGSRGGLGILGDRVLVVSPSLGEARNWSKLVLRGRGLTFVQRTGINDDDGE